MSMMPKLGPIKQSLHPAMDSAAVSVLTYLTSPTILVATVPNDNEQIVGLAEHRLDLLAVFLSQRYI